MNTRKLTTLSMLIAIYVVLSIINIRLINYKFTLEAFPILVSGLLFGPLDGLIVGTIGSFIYQLFFSGYGITPTTPLWILPHALSGLIVGYYAKKKDFNLSLKQIIFICIVSALIVTSFNLLALYVDSKLYGYYSKALVFGNLFLKIITGIVLAVIYSLAMPKLLVFLKNRNDNNK